MPIFTKSEIRSHFIKRRKSLDHNFLQNKSLVLKEKILNIDYLTKKNVAFYYPINGELNPIPSMKNISIKNSLLLPKVVKNSRVLQFLPFKFGDKLHKSLKNTNLLEPYAIKTIIPHIIFVPLVAVDKENNRIGMGGGYYDATISYYRQYNLNTKFIGLAYDFQLLSNLIDTKSHDQKLDEVILV